MRFSIILAALAILPAAIAQPTGVEAPRPSRSHLSESAWRALSGLRAYPPEVVRALLRVSEHPDVLQRIAEQPELMSEPGSSKLAAPSELHESIRILADFPEAPRIVAARTQLLSDLRRSMSNGQIAEEVERLARQYNDHAVEGAFEWQRRLESSPEAVEQYSRLMTQYVNELRREVPEFAYVRVTDPRYYLAAPPDLAVMSYLQDQTQTEPALRQTLEAWWNEYGADALDRRVQSGQPAARISGQPPLAVAPPDARREFWRAADASSGGDGAEVGLLPVVSQPPADQPFGARAAMAMAEHARVWIGATDPAGSEAVADRSYDEPQSSAPVAEEAPTVAVDDAPVVIDDQRETVVIEESPDVVVLDSPDVVVYDSYPYYTYPYYTYPYYSYPTYYYPSYFSLYFGYRPVYPCYPHGLRFTPGLYDYYLYGHHGIHCGCASCRGFGFARRHGVHHGSHFAHHANGHFDSHGKHFDSRRFLGSHWDRRRGDSHWRSGSHNWSGRDRVSVRDSHGVNRAPRSGLGSGSSSIHHRDSGVSRDSGVTRAPRAIQRSGDHAATGRSPAAIQRAPRSGSHSDVSGARRSASNLQRTPRSTLEGGVRSPNANRAARPAPRSDGSIHRAPAVQRNATPRMAPSRSAQPARPAPSIQRAPRSAPRTSFAAPGGGRSFSQNIQRAPRSSIQQAPHGRAPAAMSRSASSSIRSAAPHRGMSSPRHSMSSRGASPRIHRSSRPR